MSGPPMLSKPRPRAYPRHTAMCRLTISCTNGMVSGESLHVKTCSRTTAFQIGCVTHECTPTMHPAAAAYYAAIAVQDRVADCNYAICMIRRRSYALHGTASGPTSTAGQELPRV